MWPSSQKTTGSYSIAKEDLAKGLTAGTTCAWAEWDRVADPRDRSLTQTVMTSMSTTIMHQEPIGTYHCCILRLKTHTAFPHSAVSSDIDVETRILLVVSQNFGPSGMAESNFRRHLKKLISPFSHPLWSGFPPSSMCVAAPNIVSSWPQSSCHGWQLHPKKIEQILFVPCCPQAIQGTLTEAATYDAQTISPRKTSLLFSITTLVEGSLEVKLPTVLTDEKQRWEESEKRREEKKKKEDQRRESQKKDDPGARKGRKVAKRCVFPMICGSGGSKSRLAKAAGAEPCGQMRDEKLHAIVARSTFPSQNGQNAPGSDHFFEVEMSKSACRCGAKHIFKRTS